ncbi:MAG: DUF5074 domain-containing protein [Bacteroidia bacterium]
MIRKIRKCYTLGRIKVFVRRQEEHIELINFFSFFLRNKLGVLLVTVRFFLIFSIAILFSNCNEDPKTTPTPPITRGKGLFVVNEGTFTLGNASLYYINLDNDDKNTQEDIFKPNNNRPLGDIFQSMTLINNNAWLVINNSGKIEVINPETSKSVSTIKNLRSPRFALEVLPNKVYVTDIYSNTIHIIDATSFIKIGEIKCPGWTEELIIHQNKVWVTNFNRNYIYTINPNTDLITDSIALAYGGSSLLADKDGKVWVLCSGDLLKNKTGGLFCINPVSMKIEKQWLFSKDNFNPIKLRQNVAQDSMYFVYKGVYGFSKKSATIAASPFITEPVGSSFYGLTIQVATGNILIADAQDFVSRGKILVYSSKGVFIKSYKAGVNPSEFFWW